VRDPSLKAWLCSRAFAGACSFCEPARPATATLGQLLYRIEDEGLAGWRWTLPMMASREALTTTELLAHLDGPFVHPELADALVEEFEEFFVWDDG